MLHSLIPRPRPSVRRVGRSIADRNSAALDEKEESGEGEKCPDPSPSTLSPTGLLKLREVKDIRADGNQLPGFFQEDHGTPKYCP